MPSLIPGFEYDIFISYRQKDNKGDRWVSEFVEALKTELESTFKEEISVYFDINPHDGLLETHDVDESLKEKLKCLVFIPIISRTYCDPNAFAWEHEFKSFIEQTSKDQFGLKVRLPNGNVASRVLPVRIHDLDVSDIKECETVLGGVLRGIEFIYKEPGVNKPLTIDDDEKKNLNNTKYKIQINKMANAIKEVISAISQHDHEPEEVSEEIFKPEFAKSNKTIFFTGSIIALILIVFGILVIPKLFKSSEEVEKSIAVLPFRNLSNDTSQLYFCDGFTEEILNNLQKVKSFTVRSRTSTDQYRDTKKSTTTIGNELNVNYLVEGSVGREGDDLKIWIQLIDSRADKHIWASDYTREMKQIFSLQSEIAKEIASELKALLSPEEIDNIEKKATENFEAYNYYLQGNYYNWKGNSSQDFKTAIELYEKAIELDPGFAAAYSKIAQCHLSQYWFFTDHSEDVKYKCKQAIDKAFEIDPNLPEAHLALGYYYYWGFLKYQLALEQAEIVLKEQPGNPEAYFLLAAVYRRSGNWEKAKECFVNAFEHNPRSAQYALNAGETYDMLRDYSQAQYYYQLGCMLQPDWVDTYVYLSRMYLKSEGNTRKARELLENAVQGNKFFASDSMIIETNITIKIYDGKYQEALNDLSHYKSDVFQMQFYYRPKYLYYATIYGLMNQPQLELAYYDSARIFLENKITQIEEDPRMLSSLGIAYAGLGFIDQAINTGNKAVKLLPIDKEAYKGVFLANDLALIHVMLGQYDKALEQIDYLLSIPGSLSTKILELDPRWSPLKKQSELKKILEKHTAN